MSREEYMKQLSFLLQDISDDEKEEALAYYEDYFEEAGEDQAEAVMATLGSPEKVAAMIKESLGGGDSQAGEYTEAGYQDDRFSEFNKVPEPKMTFENEYENEYKQQKAPREAGQIILMIILGICAIPVVFPVLGTVFGGAVAVLATIFGLAVALAAAIFAAFVTGVALIGVGIAEMFTGPALGLLTIGLGLLALAVGLLLILLCANIIGRLLPWAFRGISGLFRKIFRRRGSFA